jgi:hypothetical protein
MGNTLKVIVSPFVPLPSDKVAYEWDSMDGPQKMEMPTYHISDIEGAKLAMVKYATTSALLYIEGILDSSNVILWNAFNTAIRCNVSLRVPLVKETC